MSLSKQEINKYRLLEELLKGGTIGQRHRQVNSVINVKKGDINRNRRRNVGVW